MSAFDLQVVRLGATGHYPLDEAAGGPVDLSGTRAAGAWSGSPTRQVAAMAGLKGVNVNGTAAQSAQLASAPILGNQAAWSVFWAFRSVGWTTVGPPYRPVYTERNPSSGNDIFKVEFAANTTPGDINFLYRNDAGTIRGAGGFAVAADGAWHWGGFTRSGNVVTAYLDGAQTAQDAAFSTAVSFTNSVQAWVGRDPADAAGTSFYAGDLALVSLFPSALTAAQVAGLWNTLLRSGVVVG